MSLFLSIRDPGADAPSPLELADRDVVIGRAPEADWTIVDPRISSRHLIVGVRDGSYLVRDTSSNGTTVNGRPLAGIHRLSVGDVLTIGDTAIVVGDAPAASIPSSSPLPRSTTTALTGDAALVDRLVAALGTLLATRHRQLGELRISSPDAIVRNPLVDAKGAAGKLRALPASDAASAIDEAEKAIERHHAASVAAMQAGLRAVLAEIAPDVLASSPNLPVNGDARDAALWRAYVARFDGERLSGAGFVDRFADAFRAAYERLSSTDERIGGPRATRQRVSSVPRPPS